MKTAPQELLKEYVQVQRFTSTSKIIAAMKGMFRYAIRTVMRVEIDEKVVLRSSLLIEQKLEFVHCCQLLSLSI